MKCPIRSPATLRAVILAAIVAVGMPAAPSMAENAAKPAAAPRMVNLTSDSAPGWTPSEDLERQALKAALDFLAARDEGRYADAHNMLSNLNLPDQPLATFAADGEKFNIQAGPVKSRRILFVTWTKDPAEGRAPAPGVYAAIDLASQFANIDRHCGYLIVYQPPTGGDFKVMRQEDNFIDNATAAAIGGAELNAAWSRLSANCPNYSTGGLSALPKVSQVETLPQPTQLPEAKESTIGYPTVSTALAGLRAKPGVVFTLKDGWTIAEDPAERALWSFAPPGYPAYPAAVKRMVVNDNGGAELVMSVQCEASKTACDDLVRVFQALNDQTIASLRGNK